MIAQREALVKQKTRATYLEMEGAKKMLKVAAAEQGRQMTPQERVDLEIERKSRVRRIGRPRAERRKHRKGASGSQPPPMKPKVTSPGGKAPTNR